MKRELFPNEGGDGAGWDGGGHGFAVEVEGDGGGVCAGVQRVEDDGAVRILEGDVFDFCSGGLVAGDADGVGIDEFAGVAEDVVIELGRTTGAAGLELSIVTMPRQVSQPPTTGP